MEKAAQRKSLTPEQIAQQPYIITVANNPDYEGDEPDPSFDEPVVVYAKGACLLSERHCADDTDENNDPDDPQTIVAFQIDMASIAEILMRLPEHCVETVVELIRHELALSRIQQDASRKRILSVMSEVSDFLGGSVFGDGDDDDCGIMH